MKHVKRLPRLDPAPARRVVVLRAEFVGHRPRHPVLPTRRELRRKRLEGERS